MDKMSDIQKKIDEVLASVDGIGPATPNPFFYTRLEARILRNRYNYWEKVSRAVSRPVVAVAALALVLVLNAAVVVQGVNAVDNVPDLSEMASTEDLRSSATFYDIENNQP
jgi:hypothetical protein